MLYIYVLLKVETTFSVRRTISTVVQSTSAKVYRNYTIHFTRESIFYPQFVSVAINKTRIFSEKINSYSFEISSNSVRSDAYEKKNKIAVDQTCGC